MFSLERTRPRSMYCGGIISAAHRSAKTFELRVTQLLIYYTFFTMVEVDSPIKIGFLRTTDLEI